MELCIIVYCRLKGTSLLDYSVGGEQWRFFENKIKLWSIDKCPPVVCTTSSQPKIRRSGRRARVITHINTRRLFTVFIIIINIIRVQRQLRTESGDYTERRGRAVAEHRKRPENRRKSKTSPAYRNCTQVRQRISPFVGRFKSKIVYIVYKDRIYTVHKADGGMRNRRFFSNLPSPRHHSTTRFRFTFRSHDLFDCLLNTQI